MRSLRTDEPFRRAVRRLPRSFLPSSSPEELGSHHQRRRRRRQAWEGDSRRPQSTTAQRGRSAFRAAAHWSSQCGAWQRSGRVAIEAPLIPRVSVQFLAPAGGGGGAWQPRSSVHSSVCTCPKNSPWKTKPRVGQRAVIGTAILLGRCATRNQNAPARARCSAPPACSAAATPLPPMDRLARAGSGRVADSGPRICTQNVHFVSSGRRHRERGLQPCELRCAELARAAGRVGRLRVLRLPVVYVLANELNLESDLSRNPDASIKREWRLSPER